MPPLSDNSTIRRCLHSRDTRQVTEGLWQACGGSERSGCTTRKGHWANAIIDSLRWTGEVSMQFSIYRCRVMQILTKEFRSIWIPASHLKSGLYQNGDLSSSTCSLYSFQIKKVWKWHRATSRVILPPSEWTHRFPFEDNNVDKMRLKPHYYRTW